MISSMTGFASVTLTLGPHQITLDLRSVNQRYLELNFRLADECRSLEPRLRETLGRQISRGKVECRIALNTAGTVSVPDRDNGISPTHLERVLQLQSQVRAAAPDARPLAVADLLRWPGVVQQAGLPTDLDTQIMAGVDQLLSRFVATRQREGETLKAHLLARLDAMAHTLTVLAPALPRLLTAYRERLAIRLTEALGDAAADRLAAELALFAQKIDIDEELSRLDTHLGEVRRVLARGGVVGKRLDFLMQELHREANTLGAKSVATETTQAAIELKVLIEQMREQVQNIE